MKKTYESTIDDAVATCYRLACMTGAVRKQRLAGWVFLPVALLLFCAAFAKKDDGLLLAGVMATVVTAVILIFAGTDEINEWVEFIKQHMEQGQQPSQPIAGKPGSG